MGKATKKAPPRRAVSQGLWYTLPETAEYLGMSVRYVQKRMADGTLPFHKFGTALRFHKDDLDAHIAKTRRGGR